MLQCTHESCTVRLQDLYIHFFNLKLDSPKAYCRAFDLEKDFKCRLFASSFLSARVGEEHSTVVLRFQEV